MPGFWIAGLGLFMEAESLVSESSEREHLRRCIAEAREQLREVENQSEVPESGQSNSSRGQSAFLLNNSQYFGSCTSFSIKAFRAWQQQVHPSLSLYIHQGSFLRGT